MSTLRAALLIALSAGLLAGCSKPAAPTVPATSASAAGGDGAIGEAQLPHPRAGAWERIDTDDGARSTQRFCVTDRPFNVGKVGDFCQKFVFHRTPTGGLAIDSECGKRGVTSNMHMTASGDFNAAYATDMRMTIVLAPGAAPHQVNTHADFRYLGACTPDEAVEAARIEKEARRGG